MPAHLAVCRQVVAGSAHVALNLGTALGVLQYGWYKHRQGSTENNMGAVNALVGKCRGSTWRASEVPGELGNRQAPDRSPEMPAGIRRAQQGLWRPGAPLVCAHAGCEATFTTNELFSSSPAGAAQRQSPQACTRGNRMECRPPTVGQTDGERAGARAGQRGWLQGCGSRSRSGEALPKPSRSRAQQPTRTQPAPHLACLHSQVLSKRRRRARTQARPAHRTPAQPVSHQAQHISTQHMSTQHIPSAPCLPPEPASQ